MQMHIFRGILALIWTAGILPESAGAQRSESGDEIIDAMRAQANISPLDQERIADWQRKEVEALAAAKNATEGSKYFRARMNEQFSHTGNSQEFSRQFAAQATLVAQEKFAQSNIEATIAGALARVLVDMGRPETIPGMLAGLKVADQTSRYLCAKGLAAQKNTIAADNALLSRVVQALRDAGAKESNPAVLSRMYLALSHSDHVDVVFDAFMAIFDQRLTYRRGPAQFADGAELDALEFFLQSRVATALSADQKTQLVLRIAALFRMDAERYANGSLSYEEMVKLEVSLTQAERILAQFADAGKSEVSKALETGGYSNRTQMLAGAYGWVGNPQTSVKGTLNQAPWNVPVGAP